MVNKANVNRGMPPQMKTRRKGGEPTSIPEEDARPAAYVFRDSLVSMADQMAHGLYPMWYGWALVDAFIAGAKWARKSKN